MKGFIRICVIALAPCAIAVSDVVAQVPFSTASIGVTVGTDVHHGRFQDNWRTGPTPAVHVRMPFHVGEAELGAALSRSEFTGGLDGDFWGALLHAGWGGSYVPSEVLRIQGTLLAGTFLRVFDTRQFGYARRESELMLGASAAAQVRVFAPIHLRMQTAFHRIYTSTPIDLVQVSAGLVVEFDTPDWLPPLLR